MRVPRSLFFFFFSGTWTGTSWARSSLEMSSWKDDERRRHSERHHGGPCDARIVSHCCGSLQLIIVIYLSSRLVGIYSVLPLAWLVCIIYTYYILYIHIHIYLYVYTHTYITVICSDFGTLFDIYRRFLYILIFFSMAEFVRLRSDDCVVRMCSFFSFFFFVYF